MVSYMGVSGAGLGSVRFASRTSLSRPFPITRAICGGGGGGCWVGMQGNGPQLFQLFKTTDAFSFTMISTQYQEVRERKGETYQQLRGLHLVQLEGAYA